MLLKTGSSLAQGIKLMTEFYTLLRRITLNSSAYLVFLKMQSYSILDTGGSITSNKKVIF